MYRLTLKSSSKIRCLLRWCRNTLLCAIVQLVQLADMASVGIAPNDIFMQIQAYYNKTCVKRPLKNRQNKDLYDKWLLYEGRKYSKMLPLGHSAILLTCIKW